MRQISSEEAGKSASHVAILNGPPMDHDAFQRIDCELQDDWERRAVIAVETGSKVLLANCDPGRVRTVREACLRRNFVLMLLRYPNCARLVRLYLRPERRKAPRMQPLEAEDLF